MRLVVEQGRGAETVGIGGGERPDADRLHGAGVQRREFGAALGQPARPRGRAHVGPPGRRDRGGRVGVAGRGPGVELRNARLKGLQAGERGL